MDRWWGAVGRLSAAVDERGLRAVVAVVAVVQAGVLGVLARRGSWLSDDVDLLVEGSRGFAPSELFAPANDHVVPGLRFVYAIFAKVAPLNHDLTVAWRVVVQALAIYLFGRLLLRLLGTSWWVVAGTALYAASPLTMPSFMNLSSGISNLQVHVFGLLALHATLDWFDGRRKRALLVGPLAVLGALLFWEKSALILVTALALALYQRRTTLRSWLRTAWPFAIALALPVVGFGVAYLAFRKDDSGSWPGLGTSVELLGETVQRTLLPAGVGGPWRWTAPSPPYSLADPPVVTFWLGLVVLVALLALAVRRAPRTLWLWAAVAIYLPVIVVLVGYGRYAFFGSVLTMNYHYWSDLAIPFVLALVLTLRDGLPRVASRPLTAVPALALLVAWLAGAGISSAGFARTWDDNPSKPYFTNLRADIDAAGGSANLWDTDVPGGVLTLLSPDRRISPILAMSGWPARIQTADGEPRIVDDEGHLRPARLAFTSDAVMPRRENEICGLSLSDGRSVDLKLSAPVTPARWFARLSYYSNTEHALRVELLDSDSDTVTEVPSRVPSWPASSLTAAYYGPSRSTGADTVRLTAPDGVNVCLGGVQIGIPVVDE